MAQNMALEAPLSQYAELRLYQLKASYVLTPGSWLMGGGILWGILSRIILSCLCESKVASVLTVRCIFGSYYLACGLWLIVRRIKFTLDHKSRDQILQDNARDWSQAGCLRTEIFPKFANVRSDQFPPRENALEGLWRAFRVEHFTSQSLRGDITGEACVKSLFAGDGKINAQFRQLAVPDLLDMNSVVFFRNDLGETIRVLIPSPRATKETLVRLIEFYLGCPLEHYWETTYRASALSAGTHVHEALKQFTVSEASLLQPISHPELLDRLDVATQEPLEKRPLVQVIGAPVQRGVALATALAIDGVKQIFYPSGYLGDFASGVAFVLDRNSKPANLLEAVS